MVRRLIIWSAKCFGCAIIGFIVCVEVTRYANLAIWWLLKQANATDLGLFAFQFPHYLLRRALFGFVLGLIPIALGREIARSYFARLTPKHLPIAPELDWHRPLLWAWFPFAIIFLVRFTIWRPVDSSVFASVSLVQRWHHFFDESQLGGWGSWSMDGGQLMFDLGAIVGPMLFLLAYTLGVWTRNKWPSLRHPTEDLDLDEPVFEQPADLH